MGFGLGIVPVIRAELSSGLGHLQHNSVAWVHRGTRSWLDLHNCPVSGHVYVLVLRCRGGEFDIRKSETFQLFFGDLRVLSRQVRNGSWDRCSWIRL